MDATALDLVTTLQQLPTVLAIGALKAYIGVALTLGLTYLAADKLS